MDVSFAMATNALKSAMDQQAMVANRITGMAKNPQSADLAMESVKQINNQQTVAANSKTVQSTDQMLGTLVDLVG
ncbi:hypothetical protein JW960_29620 [candidate division KSB1 bacterium]|nr:hypothetical protein [candidate division KSB1 bacterium]